MPENNIVNRVCKKLGVTQNIVSEYSIFVVSRKWFSENYYD